MHEVSGFYTTYNIVSTNAYNFSTNRSLKNEMYSKELVIFRRSNHLEEMRKGENLLTKTKLHEENKSLTSISNASAILRIVMP